jgi:hypothetical protein
MWLNFDDRKWPIFKRPLTNENGFDLCFALKGNLRSEKAMSNSFRENNLVPDA